MRYLLAKVADSLKIEKKHLKFWSLRKRQVINSKTGSPNMTPKAVHAFYMNLPVFPKQKHVPLQEIASNDRRQKTP